MVVVFACSALALAAWAGDPWKEKTYKEWDEKDVNKILTDSPWARPITVLATWRSGDKSLPASAAQHTGGAGAAGERSGGIGTDVTNAINAEVGGASAGDPTQARFTLRWGSARTVREAAARLSILRGMSVTEAERVMNLPVAEHQIVLYGPDMTPFTKSNEKGLMDTTSLTLKKSKQKISPSRVEIRTSQGGKLISGIVFYFPMKSATGELFIAPDEKGVEFECRTGVVTIRQIFEPQKMSSKAGPDFH
jgi:hypothetical protein